MSNIIIPGNPTCPLCLKRMKRLRTRTEYFFACFTNTCMISINAIDINVSKWDLREAPPCTICGTKMRAFFRADGYMKMQCPACLKKGKLVQVVRGKVEFLTPEERNAKGD